MAPGPEPPLLSAVVHEALIAIAGERMEAAAATAVNEDVASERPEETPGPVVSRADRPFIFPIRNEETEAILFLGRLTSAAR